MAMQQLTPTSNIYDYCNMMDIKPSIVVDTIARLLSEELQTDVFVQKQENDLQFYRLNKDGNTSKVGPKRFGKICSKFEKEIFKYIIDDKKPKVDDIIKGTIKRLGQSNIVLSFLNYSIIVRKEQLPLPTNQYIVGDTLVVKITRIDKDKIYATRIDRDIINNILQNFIPSHVKFYIYIDKKKERKSIYLNVMPPYIGKLEIEMLKKLDFRFYVRKAKKKEI